MDEEPSRDRFIKIENQSIYLTPAFSLPISKTNLGPSLMFRQDQAYFWQVWISDFDTKSGQLSLQVLDYYPLSHQGFEQQSMRYAIDFLAFEPLEWKYLEPFLSSYHKEDLLDFIIDSEEVFVPDLTKHEIPFSLKVYIKDVSFHLGCVSFHHYFDLLGREIEIRVRNEHILPEFDFIKQYFARQLRRKTIEVDGLLTLRGTQVVHLEATSDQLNLIDGAVIETLKWTGVKKLTKQNFIKTIDKSLFTAEEAWDVIELDGWTNAARLPVNDIIQMLAEKGVVRNKKQLTYLAGSKQSAEHKIYLTLNPIFGFLFLIEGAEMYHFCWELLNSHATYLWSAPRREWQLSDAHRAVEQIIQEIRTFGRDRYKQAYARGNSNSGLIFQHIVHRRVDSHVIDAFPLWRKRLEERLV